MAIGRTGNSNQMWGGRFEGGPAAVMREINASISVDKRLWREDIAASRAHAAMLAKQGDPEGGYSVGTGRTVGEAVMDALTAWGEKL